MTDSAPQKNVPEYEEGKEPWRGMLFKVLGENGDARMGTGSWSLPHKDPETGEWIPGEWMPAIEGPLEPCRNGYHLCRAGHLVFWLGPTIYEAEIHPEDSEVVEVSDKIVVRRARLLRQMEKWTPRTARQFAADCAEYVLPIYEKEFPDDRRPREAIEAARKLAETESDEPLGPATRRAG